MLYSIRRVARLYYGTWIYASADRQRAVYSPNKNEPHGRRKSYMVYRTAPFSMTLNNPKPRSRSLHYLTLNILQTVGDTDIVTTKY